MENQIAGIAISELVHEASKPKAQLIWDTLSRINVNDRIEKKNGFSYLSWAWAWGVLMDNFPNSKFSFDKFGEHGGEVFYYPDFSAEVRCALTVDGVTRVMWLPVMDHRNKPILKPDARAINDTKMRCLVKAMALFGLGHYIYAGEDLPDASKSQPEPATPAPAAKLSEGTSTAPFAEVTVEPADQLVLELKEAKSLAELKAAFTRASKYAKNRNDIELLALYTALKDERKGGLN